MDYNRNAQNGAINGNISEIYVCFSGGDVASEKNFPLLSHQEDANFFLNPVIAKKFHLYNLSLQVYFFVGRAVIFSSFTHSLSLALTIFDR